MLSAGVLAATEVAGGCDSAGAVVSSDFFISSVTGEFALTVCSVVAGAGTGADAPAGGSKAEIGSGWGSGAGSGAGAGVSTGAGDFGGDAATLAPLVIGVALGE